MTRSRRLEKSEIVVGSISEDVAETVLEAKVKAIMESAMPESQKQEYLRQIGAITPASDEGKIPYNVYAKVRRVPRESHNAMMVYPKAKNVRLASLGEWDEIFKDF